MKHRPELDGLRGIAILLVLGAHTQTPGFPDGAAGTGVTLFFVLSGFLITSLLLAELGRSGRVDLRIFYGRRALRLVPGLVAVLVVVAILASLRFMPPAAMAGTDYRTAVLGAGTYLANWFAVAGQSLGMLGHTWSLAVEGQFYLLWPALLLVGLRLGRERLAVVVLVAICLVTPYRFLVGQTGDCMHVLVGTDTHADALLLGCVLAILGTRWHQSFGWLGLAGICAVALLWTNDRPGEWVLTIPAAAVASTMAVGGCPRALAWRPLVFFGKISYGLYLWHGLVIWWALPWFVAVPLSVGIAWVSYVALESPFLRLKDRVGATRRQLEPAPSQAYGIARGE
jgi:peptidoglycan/LPS O-acetylase OafA/YrhL